jgi:hypothetical protein
MTVADLDSRLGGASELTEWIAFEKMTGPLGRRRSDIQAATIAATIANANRGKKGKKLKIRDFLIPYGEKDRPKTGREMLDLVRGINAGLGGVERGRSDD